ncbi:MAG TPA: sigma-70 family RNA polymerase sigma factor [Gemmataceae bacterium]|nr:sigma-70 family RNA polymerase sigma factor [Gemmataceae bacterium]
MADDRPDADLVAAARAGDESAVATLDARHRLSLARCLTLLTGDADEAESLAQESLVRAFDRLADFRAELSFFAWLRGIGLNLARNFLRARTRHARAVGPDGLADVAAREGRRHGVLSGILRRELSDQMGRAIQDLPEAYREAFVLHAVEGLDYATVATLTGETANNLRVRALRARRLLRGQLGPVVDTWVRLGPDD